MFIVWTRQIARAIAKEFPSDSPAFVLFCNRFLQNPVKKHCQQKTLIGYDRTVNATGAVTHFYFFDISELTG